MSTLEYLDHDGRVSYKFVPWNLLNNWLSNVNTNGNVGEKPPRSVNRGKITEELQERTKKTNNGIKELMIRGVGINRGYGQDWCQYENEKGFTHLEELLIYQPNEWRTQAREYLYRFHFDVERRSYNSKRSMEWTIEIKKDKHKVPIFLWSPIHVVLYHREMKRSSRYEPINFLLAYGSSNPLPSLYESIHYMVGKNILTEMIEDQLSIECLIDKLKELDVHRKNDDPKYKSLTCSSRLSVELVDKMKVEMSPLDYFFDFAGGVQDYSLEVLSDVGKSTGVPRLWLMNELDYSLIVGQRVAKQNIREAVVTHFWNRSETKDEMCSNYGQPLSMIFAGPSGNGKTELAVWLSKLLNKPDDDAFHKVDCGKVRAGKELFGMSGGYRGSTEGSALNNFICRLASDNESVGVVLLDEIEKAEESVIHGLYQVLDKGEWTNKRLEQNRSQTEVISCRNIIFIMTTNAADTLITKYAAKNQGMYIDDMDDLEDKVDELSFKVQVKLQSTYPFTDAFIGRIGKVIPFLPMAKDEEKQQPLLMEMKTVAKLIIEREEEKLSTGEQKNIDLKINISPEEKDQMADLIVKCTPSQSGVRGIQKKAREKVSNKLKHKCALKPKKGGIGNGSEVTFFVNRHKNQISFRENINSSGSFRVEEDFMNNLSESGSESESGDY